MYDLSQMMVVMQLKILQINQWMWKKLGYVEEVKKKDLMVAEEKQILIELLEVAMLLVMREERKKIMSMVMTWMMWCR